MRTPSTARRQGAMRLGMSAIAVSILLAGCDDSGNSKSLDAKDIRPAGEAAVAPPGDSVKLNSNNSGGPGAAKPKPEAK